MSSPTESSPAPPDKKSSAEGYRKLIAYLAALVCVIAMEYLKAGDPYAVAAILAVYVGGNSAEHFARRKK